MPFFMVDDQLHVNRKATMLAEEALENDLLGIGAMGLWTMAGSVCQAALTDGLISERQLVKILLNKDAVDLLAGKLVEVGLWHGYGHGCESCPPVAAGSFLFHDWFSLGYDRGADVRLARDKRKELKDAKLIAAVWARDCTDSPNATRARCRYCGTEVKRATQKGDRRPELDHVDPTKAVGPSNVVIACATCNRQKGRRTPEQAGFTLKPAPERATARATVERPAPDSPGTAPVAPSEHDAVEPQQDPAVRFNARVDAKPARRPAPTASERIEIPIELDKADRSDPISEEKAVHGRTHAGTRAGRAGQGTEGLTSGPPAGQPRSIPQPSSKSRRRGKRGKKVDPVSTGPETGTDAGVAPEVSTGGRFGSPWHGWSGRPSSVTETTCPDHGQEMPCRKCQDSSESGGRRA